MFWVCLQHFGSNKLIKFSVGWTFFRPTLKTLEGSTPTSMHYCKAPVRATPSEHHGRASYFNSYFCVLNDNTFWGYLWNLKVKIMVFNHISNTPSAQMPAEGEGRVLNPSARTAQPGAWHQAARRSPVPRSSVRSPRPAAARPWLSRPSEPRPLLPQPRPPSAQARGAVPSLGRPAPDVTSLAGAAQFDGPETRLPEGSPSG